MSRYFARLARHTGINVTGVRPAVAAPAAGRARDEITAVVRSAPLHVIETTMIEPHVEARRADAVEASVPASRIEAPIRGAMRADEPRPLEARPVAPAPEAPMRGPMSPTSGTEAVRPVRVDVREAVHDRGNGQSRRSDDGAQPVSPRRDDLADDKSAATSLELSRHVAAWRQERPVAVETPEMSSSPVVATHDRRHREAVPHELLAQRYLKEVRAWLEAPPEIQVVSAASGPDEHRRSQAADPFVDGSAVERMTRPVSREPSLDVQDLSVSIGSINLVIEEPAPQTAPVLSPARVERQPAHETPAPTALSRYYLRQW